jgi:hypothetical protein
MTVFAAGVLVLIGCWLLLLRMPATATLPLAASLVVALGSRLRPRARLATALALVLTMAVGWRTPLRELRGSLDRLRLAKDRHGAAGLNTGDALAVYGLNLVMGLGGLAAGFPEVARETLLLCVPGPTVRAWHSDFAMRSPKVREQVQRLSALTAHENGTRLAMPRVWIAWSGYAFGSDSMRVALALNSPLELTGTAHREGDRWRLDLVGSARSQYPPRALITIGQVDGAPIVLDEGLFWVLQERGWLHPFTAEWHWSILSDDARLRDLRTAELSWRELLVARLVGTR